MNAPILQQILAELQSVKTGQAEMQSDIREMKSDISPLLTQAVLETINLLEIKIDILNRRQLKLEADVEQLKRK